MGDKVVTGIWAPVTTPFDENLAPDSQSFIAHIGHVLSEGCHGVVLFGTTGEATSLSTIERKTLLEQVLSAGIPAHQLIVGTGLCALPETIDLTQHALNCGVTRVLMLPPFYYKSVSDEGLFRAYAQVIDRVADEKLRVLLYHFPRLSGVAICHAVIDRLLQRYGACIAGLKDSTGDEESTYGFIENYPDLDILPGTERFLLSALERGASGCITASANVNATALRALWQAFVTEDPNAQARQTALTAVRGAHETTPAIPGLKALLARKYGTPGWARPRPPLVELSQVEIDNLLKELRNVGAVLDGPSVELTK